jgi:cobalt-zinc-cadmium efflux system membrane fusion protein
MSCKSPGRRANLMEKFSMNTLKLIALCLFLTLVTPIHAEQADHDIQETVAEHQMEAAGQGDNEEEGEGGAVEISVEQQRVAGIVVELLQRRGLATEISAPGQVKLNAYLTRKVAPRITAQIMQRHVRLGEHVTTGQPLVTLSSVEMAEAQGALQVAELEWRRVESLGKSTVSERRYNEAQVAQQQARSRVGAYGMTSGQITALLAGNKVSADGMFQLLALQPGTVIRDEFVEGEYVEPGRELFEISDESQIWVEANLTPEEALGVKTNSPARVRVGDTWFEGRVIQAHHVLDETTRTLAVRIEVANPDEQLHPGLFVDTRIVGSDLADVIAVPEDAVLRSADGDWAVFIEEAPGKFESLEVEVIRTLNGLAVIEGVPAGTRVVTEGAFFVQSEIAKSGFDIHNH